MPTRRQFVATAAAAAATACSRTEPEVVARKAPVEPPPPPPMPERYGAITDEPYPVPAIPPGVVPEKLWRQRVDNPFPQYGPGTIIVDPDAAFLHLVEEDGRALRYGVSVGAAGFEWNGDAVLQYRRKWPTWKPPQEMIERRPEFEPYSVANGGMPPGPDNPLGARALYLFRNGKDTLYRIHGACEPAYLGQAVSSGCIRMLDQDVIDLYDRVTDGVPVIVLRSIKPKGLSPVY